ncbi:hypothetical protein GGU11DRAFT_798097 [Lentinula aff. detonsa]|nr:hypothetical protein GGU11DRAFT_798097 [Lentinula aff. detonsa]
MSFLNSKSITSLNPNPNPINRNRIHPQSFSSAIRNHCPSNIFSPKFSEVHFDFVAPTFCLQPLFSIHTNPSILKILSNGGMDFCALYHTYRINLDPVLDLQLVDFRSRFARDRIKAGSRIYISFKVREGVWRNMLITKHG